MRDVAQVPHFGLAAIDAENLEKPQDLGGESCATRSPNVQSSRCEVRRQKVKLLIPGHIPGSFCKFRIVCLIFPPLRQRQFCGEARRTAPKRFLRSRRDNVGCHAKTRWRLSPEKRSKQTLAHLCRGCEQKKGPAGANLPRLQSSRRRAGSARSRLFASCRVRQAGFSETRRTCLQIGDRQPNELNRASSSFAATGSCGVRPRRPPRSGTRALVQPAYQHKRPGQYESGLKSGWSWRAASWTLPSRRSKNSRSTIKPPPGLEGGHEFVQAALATNRRALSVHPRLKSLVHRRERVRPKAAATQMINRGSGVV